MIYDVNIKTDFAVWWAGVMALGPVVSWSNALLGEVSWLMIW